MRCKTDKFVLFSQHVRVVPLPPAVALSSTTSSCAQCFTPAVVLHAAHQQLCLVLHTSSCASCYIPRVVLSATTSRCALCRYHQQLCLVLPPAVVLCDATTSSCAQCYHQQLCLVLHTSMLQISSCAQCYHQLQCLVLPPAVVLSATHQQLCLVLPPAVVLMNRWRYPTVGGKRLNKCTSQQCVKQITKAENKDCRRICRYSQGSVSEDPQRLSRVPAVILGRV